jgi:hypothetical protein
MKIHANPEKLSSTSDVINSLDISVSGGKQWQTTPKNLPRMQHTRAIPVA